MLNYCYLINYISITAKFLYQFRIKVEIKKQKRNFFDKIRKILM